MELFHREDNKFHRSDYPVARVAYEVYQLRATLSAIFGVEMPERDVKDFVPKFTYEKQEETEPQDFERMKKEAVKANQQKYLSMFGLDKEGNPTRDVIIPSLKIATEIQKAAMEGTVESSENAKAAQGHTTEINDENPMHKALLRQVKGRKGK